MTEINKKEYAQKILDEFNKRTGLTCIVTDTEDESKYFHLRGEFLGWEITGQGDIGTDDFYAIKARKNGIKIEEKEVTAQNLASYREAPKELRLKKLKIEAEIAKLNIDLEMVEKEINLASFN